VRAALEKAHGGELGAVDLAGRLHDSPSWLAPMPFDHRPARISERARTLAALGGLRVVGGPGDHAAHDPLRDGAQAEARAGDVDVPVRDPRAPRPPAVGGDVLVLARNAEVAQVDALDAAEV